MIRKRTCRISGAVELVQSDRSTLIRRGFRWASDCLRLANTANACVKLSKVCTFMSSLRLPWNIPAGKYSLLATIFGAGFLLAGCAQEPSQERTSGVWRKDNTNEYFSQKRYGSASPRVVGNGRRVPRGGGRYLVGKPYKIAGKRYFPRQYSAGHTQVGRASWYGDAFHGRKTANGEIYDMSSISAAHPTMPLPSYARVTNQKNGRSIVVRVNDRGPFHGGRVMDLSKRVADLLDFRRAGTATIKVEYIKPAGLAGSDDRQLLASLRTDGSPAQMDGSPTFGRTMIAERNREPERQPQRAPVPAPAAVVASGRNEPAASPVIETTTAGRTTLARNGGAGAPDATVPEGENVSLPATSPLPVARPFDLATIPGAATPIAATAAGTNVARVTFFAPFSPHASQARRLRKRAPFAGLDLTGLKPLRRAD